MALATGRHLPSGEDSELAWGTSQDSVNASTKPVTAGGNEQERRVGGCYREGRCGLRYFTVPNFNFMEGGVPILVDGKI